MAAAKIFPKICKDDFLQYFFVDSTKSGVIY